MVTNYEGQLVCPPAPARVDLLWPGAIFER